MAINKVEYGGNTLIDLTSDTVTPESLLKGIIAHNKAGEKITGTYDKIPDGYIKPTGNLTDALISRSSNVEDGGHKATIPAGYYVNSALTIKEWNSGLIRSSTGSTGASLNVPPNVIGFTPVYALLVALGINSDNAANTVIAAYGNNASAYSAAYLYAGAKASLSKTFPINSTYNTVNINSSGITFVGLSGVKYASSFDYRWFAFR